MKRALKALISVTICISCFMTVASADAETVIVSFDTIEDIMLQNSLDLQKIKADLDKARGDYSDSERSVEDLKAKNKVAPDSDLTMQYNAAKTNRDTANIYYLTLQMQYDKNVMLKVLNAKQLYLTYTMDLQQEKVKSMQLENHKLEMAANEAKLKLGLITKNEFNAANLEHQLLTDSQSAQQQKTAGDLKFLKTALGVAQPAPITVLPASFNEAVFSLIPTINFEEDLEGMLLNNADIKAKESSLQIMREAVIKKTRDINVVKVELEQANESAMQNFLMQYNALMEAYRNYETAAAALKIKEEAAENGRLLFAYGYCSRLRLNELALSESMAKLNETALKNSLICTYLRYVQMRNGN